MYSTQTKSHTVCRTIYRKNNSQLVNRTPVSSGTKRFIELSICKLTILENHVYSNYLIPREAFCLRLCLHLTPFVSIPVNSSRVLYWTSRRQTKRSVKSRTGHITDINFLNHDKIIIYLYTKQKPNINPNLTDYLTCSTA